MEFILSLAIKSIEQVWLALLHNWPYLVVSVVVATLLKLYVDAEKVSAFLSRYRGAGVVAATAAAVATPLCSCGTTAVILGMMASRITWAPIVAFMVASPLSSPEGLVYSAGLFGWPFALAFYLASILLGLGGGWIAAALESRGWLAGQARFAEPASAPCACDPGRPPMTRGRVFSLDVPGASLGDPAPACGCAGAAPAAKSSKVAPAASCGCGQTVAAHSREEPASACACNPASPVQARRHTAGGLHAWRRETVGQADVSIPRRRVGPAAFGKELYGAGKQLLIMFVGFAFIGYFLNGLIPAAWVTALFGGGNLYSVPLAATLGLPLYINSETSLPLIRALLDNGMSQGAALAFLIVGAGTSIGAVAGALAIARWRVVALVVGVLWLGAIVCGYAFNLLLMWNLF